ncbi:uncharacterized protein LOC112589429 [Harpegnathos saltator]|uniref:uncharacterized protein LOC112589429 n=1 Tax=Harpegnathos saltator TaxID=610380 RepID=UPI000DBEEB77|nr:uncharacterized protein LOC112589429 [Harpegnathos saltator]
MHRNDHDLPLSTLVANQSPSKPKKNRLIKINWRPHTLRNPCKTPRKLREQLLLKTINNTSESQEAIRLRPLTLVEIARMLMIQDVLFVMKNTVRVVKIGTAVTSVQCGHTSFVV